ncbi:MAG: pyridoxal-phosphate dependent enzyme [Desulfurococcaceae archaeon]
MQLKCVKCGYLSIENRHPLCPVCGSFMHPIHNLEQPIASKGYGVWRYSGNLPYFEKNLTLGEGATPLIKSSKIFSNEVYFKDEGRNPTGSFRDRAASLIVSDAVECKAKRIVVASDGNMSSSVVAYAARAGIEVTVYVPSWIDVEKIALMKAYGANVIVKDSPLDELLEYVNKRSRKEGFYNASSTYNALSIEGLKTISFELWEQLGSVSEVYVPLGSGLTVFSIYHGFQELKQLGLIDRIPRIIGVETCSNPIYSETLKSNVSKCSEEPLPGLSYRKPIIMEFVLEILDEYGEVVVVSRKEIIEAAKKAVRVEGLFIELSSAVSLAGAEKKGALDNSVIILTGHGLKGYSAYSKPSKAKMINLFPGSTKNLIISLLKEKPGLTGYDIWKNIGLSISVQAIYQHLHDLEKRGYIRSIYENGVRKYYPIM